VQRFTDCVMRWGLLIQNYVADALDENISISVNMDNTVLYHLGSKCNLRKSDISLPGRD
jgi:hypothetical protein